MPTAPLSKKPPSTASSVAASQAPRRGPITPASTLADAPAPKIPAWGQKSVLRKPDAPSALLRKAVNTQASQIEPSMTSAMQKLTITNTDGPPSPPNNCYDPSFGPNPVDNVQDAWQGSACPTLITNVSNFRGAVFNRTCKRTTRTVDDFKQGQIIAVPYHVPNLNPKNSATHPRLTLTCEGPVFSKRRLVCVLFKFQDDLFCLTLHTFEGQGLGIKPEQTKFEYVAVVNKGSTEKFRNPGKYQPVEVETYQPDRPMKDTSCIKLTGGVTVNSSEHASYVGRVDRASFIILMLLYEQRNKKAKEKPWEPDDPKPTI